MNIIKFPIKDLKWDTHKETKFAARELMRAILLTSPSERLMLPEDDIPSVDLLSIGEKYLFEPMTIEQLQLRIKSDIDKAVSINNQDDQAAFFYVIDDFQIYNKERTINENLGFVIEDENQILLKINYSFSTTQFYDEDKIKKINNNNQRTEYIGDSLVERNKKLEDKFKNSLTYRNSITNSGSLVIQDEINFTINDITI